MQTVRVLAHSLVVALLAFTFGCAPEYYQSDEAYAQAGNGAPSGPHFNLNIIGVPKGKSADLTSSDGRRIFMPLAGRSRINLVEGADFAVLDANGTDGSAAFQL